ncbi:hypothetical protein ABZ023_28340 [Streptomyces sp. NPDC006367]|uniref:hypothetical protein n=1 Tax=unclassified Streptomyces TaxID=2593676 RepID=UPI0033A251E1
MNDNRAALAAAVAGGYLLGRTRKAKLALAVGSYLAGRRLGLSPGRVLSQGLGQLPLTPQFQELSDQVRGELLTAGRAAVTAAAGRKLTGLADALRDRTDALTGAGPREDGAGDPDGPYDGAPDGVPYDDEPDDDEPDEEVPDEDEYFDEEESEEDRAPAPAPPRRATGRATGKAPRRKAAPARASRRGGRG